MSGRGFEDWHFMSVLTWGERPQGVWLLEVVDKVNEMHLSLEHEVHSQTL